VERQHLDTFDTTGASRSVDFFWTSGKMANVTLQNKMIMFVTAQSLGPS